MLTFKKAKIIIYKMRSKGLVNLTLTKHIECKCVMVKQRARMDSGIGSGSNVKGINVAKSYWRWRRAMITYAMMASVI